jgi:hypothetical protein
MDKRAEVIINLLVIANDMRNDDSDFGRLCVAEIEKIAENMMISLGIDERTAKNAIRELLFTMAEAKTAKEFVDRLAYVYDVATRNEIGIDIIMGAIKAMMGQRLHNHKVEINMLAKQKPEMKDFLSKLIT